MKPIYCNFTYPSPVGSGAVMHVEEARTLGLENVPAFGMSDFERLMDERGVTRVMFYRTDFPRSSVSRRQVRRYLARLLRDHRQEGCRMYIVPAGPPTPISELGW